MGCGCSKRNGKRGTPPRRIPPSPTPPSSNGDSGGGISSLSVSSTTSNVTSSPSNNINVNEEQKPDYTRGASGVIKEKGEARKEIERLRRMAILKKMGKI